MGKGKLKKIKCRTCKQAFKIGKINFDEVIGHCNRPDCDLRNSELTALIKEAHKVLKSPQEFIEIEISDPLVIKVDKHGNETRTMS